MEVAIERLSYGRVEREWLDRKGRHYLQNAPPSCLFALGVREAFAGLFGETIGQGPLLGLCLVGRPIARMLPQDGTVGEVTRMVLMPGLPHGTASAVLRKAAAIARARGMRSLIAYHDRTRHSGCIYRKSGFRKDGATDPTKIRHGVGRTDGLTRASAGYEATPKRRWRLDLTPSEASRGRPAASSPVLAPPRA